MAEPKYLNDKDQWVLAEDIPDMDFFFSQIWTSCFANEIQNSGQKSYKKVLAVYKGYHLWFYFGDKDSFEVGEYLANLIVKNPQFAVKVNKEILKWSDKLRAYAEKIPENNFDTFTNQKLWELYDGHDQVHTEYYTWGWLPVAADMFHNNLTNSLKDLLKTNDIPEEKLNEYFVILTQPTKKSLIQFEHEQFFALAAAIQKDSAQRTLFEAFSVQCKDLTDMDMERKAHEIIPRIAPAILERIKKHHATYSYVNHMWVAKASTVEYYVKELAKLVAGPDVQTAIDKEEAEYAANLKKREELLKQVTLDAGTRTLFDQFGDFMVTKIYRRFAQIYAIYKMEFVQEEIGRRLGLTLKQVRFMLPEEVKAALLENKLDKAELRKREKFCVKFSERGNEVVYTGQKAKALADEAQKVKIENVEEFKGQTGCLGRGTGIVRIVNAPADMAKMKQGDILVSIATNPDIVPAMKKAAAIVTDQGGVTSHAAIVSRELNIPCVIGTKIATKVLKDGDKVEVDAHKGIVKVVKRA